MTLKTISLAAGIACAATAVVSLLTFAAEFQHYIPYYSEHPLMFVSFAVGLVRELVVAAAFLVIYRQVRRVSPREGPAAPG